MTERSDCPECGRDLMAGLCVSCGWHRPFDALLHENFAPDATCEWCKPAIRRRDAGSSSAKSL